MQDKNHDAKIAGAAKPLIFTDPETGKVLTLWPEQLSDKDTIELDAWVRAYYLYIQRSNIPENATNEEKDRIERIAQEAACSLNWYSGQGIRIMASIEGLSQIAYMSLRKRASNFNILTPEKIRAFMMDERNQDQFNDVFQELNLADELQTANPTIRGRSRKVKKVRPTRRQTPTAMKRQKKKR